jgi:hypothetical protein
MERTNSEAGAGHIRGDGQARKAGKLAWSIMNQPVAGAADPGVSMRMLQDLLKELQMRAGTWQCEKLGARSAARGPHGRRAAGLLPGSPRNEREPQ